MQKIFDMAVSKVPELFEFNDFVNNLSNEQLELVLRYFDFLRALIEENQRKAAHSMVSSLMYYLAECKANYPQKQSLTRPEQICGQYLSLVETHCREQHRVEWYAGQMCLAPKYLSNIVHKTLNSSPNAYIDQAIIRHAKSLLSSTSLSIQQISDRLGFQNQSHFGTFFKRQTGLNPSAFKTSIK